MMGYEKINDFMEAVFIQFYSENMDVELIYTDEFYVNMKSIKLWNWSPRDYSSILQLTLMIG